MICYIDAWCPVLWPLFYYVHLLFEQVTQQYVPCHTINLQIYNSMCNCSHYGLLLLDAHYSSVLLIFGQILHQYVPSPHYMHVILLFILLYAPCSPIWWHYMLFVKVLCALCPRYWCCVPIAQVNHPSFGHIFHYWCVF